jgi:hypothetical protein
MCVDVAARAGVPGLAKQSGIVESSRSFAMSLMRTLAVAWSSTVLFAACGDKKPTEVPTPAPAAVPSGVDKGNAPPVVEAKPDEGKVAVAEKPVEVAEKPVEVAEKPVEVVEKPVEVAEKPVEVAEKPVEAAEEPSEEPSTEVTALAPDLEVVDSALTPAVEDRLPTERRTTWKIGEDTRLIGWFELKNPSSPMDLELVWKKDGKENWRFPTNVGTGKNWKTWAEKRIGKRDAGAWTVELVDANGYVYSKLSYTVE